MPHIKPEDYGKKGKTWFVGRIKSRKKHVVEHRTTAEHREAVVKANEAVQNARKAEKEKERRLNVMQSQVEALPAYNPAVRAAFSHCRGYQNRANRARKYTHPHRPISIREYRSINETQEANGAARAVVHMAPDGDAGGGEGGNTAGSGTDET
jgi:hypothetical protein